MQYLTQVGWAHHALPALNKKRQKAIKCTNVNYHKHTLMAGTKKKATPHEDSSTSLPPLHSTEQWGRGGGGAGRHGWQKDEDNPLEERGTEGKTDREKRITFTATSIFPSKLH